MSTKQKVIVISLGGSMIVPEVGKVDDKFLKEFKKIIISRLAKKEKFIIVSGGGKTARLYQNAAEKIQKTVASDLDWLGIHATRLNAHLVKTIFKGFVEEKINDNPTVKNKFNKSILVGSGWRPGCSTDYDAVLLAKLYGSKIIINLSNIDYVYDKDPKKYKTAKKIKEISWNDYRKLIGKKWQPGANWPFDPIASRLAATEKMTVVVLNGKNLANFKKYLETKDFVGTVIGPK